MTPETIRNAMNKVIKRRVAEEIAESRLQEGNLPQEISIDMEPVARSLLVLVKAMKEAEERADQRDKDMVAILKGIAEQQERMIVAHEGLLKMEKARRNSKLTGKIDAETGEITVERVAK